MLYGFPLIHSKLFEHGPGVVFIGNDEGFLFKVVGDTYPVYQLHALHICCGKAANHLVLELREHHIIDSSKHQVIAVGGEDGLWFVAPMHCVVVDEVIVRVLAEDTGVNLELVEADLNHVRVNNTVHLLGVWRKP